MKQTFDQWMKEIDSIASKEGWVRNKWKFPNFEKVWFKMYEEGLDAETAWKIVPEE